MPGFDRSGPQGMGPMTGGARGYCNPSGAGGMIGRGYGRGMAYGRGGFGLGRGFRRGFGAGASTVYASPFPYAGGSEMDRLKAQAESFKTTLDQINRRIAELEDNPE